MLRACSLLALRRLYQGQEPRILRFDKAVKLAAPAGRKHPIRRNMSTTEAKMAGVTRRMISAKAEQFTESVIREMTRLALKHNAVNLSQGFPDFAAPEEIKEAA